MNIDNELKKAVEVLKAGGTILYPTDTIWGIGCDATNKSAVEKVYKIKQRSESKSLIVLIENELLLNKYLKEVPEIAWELIEHADSPLTIVYPDARGLANNVVNEDGSIAIRIVKDEFCEKLIHRLGKPLVSTSANVSGEPSPKNYHEISEHILHAVDYVVNLRQAESLNQKPSSIIQVGIKGEIKIIRK